MQTKFASLMKTSVAIAAIAILAVSCKKDSETGSPLQTQNKTAAVSGISTATITGRYGNPALGPTAFGTVYFNLTTGAQDTVGTAGPYDVYFTSTNNSVVQVPAGGSLKFLYLESNPAFSTLKTSQFTAAAVASIGRNTGSGASTNGWYNYVVPAGVTAIPGAFILVTTAENETYALRFTSAVGQGSATSNRGVYGIEYGLIDNL